MITHLCRPWQIHAMKSIRLFGMKSIPKEEERFFSLLVVNRPGTLTQIAQAFAALHTNMGSLSVHQTVVPELSRMTIVACVNEHMTSKILRRLRRMVCVTFLHVTTMEHCLFDESSVLQSQLLLRLEYPKSKKNEIELLISKYNGIQIEENEPGMIPHDMDRSKSLKSIYHVVNAPHILNTLIHRLTLDGIHVIECQSAGPCFLDIYTQSTLQAKPLQSTTPTTARPEYSKSRRKLHERIASQLFFPSHVPSMLLRPKFILLLGIPGSGKTSILSELDQSERIVLNDFVNFDVDDIIALLPEFYKAMLNIGLGNLQDDVIDPHIRYNQCQEEAKYILDINLKQAKNERRNIILHGSGRSLKKYREILNELDSRYEIHVMCVDIPYEIAIERVNQRSNGYGRNVPHEFINEAATRIRETFPTLAKELPYAHVFDSTQWPPVLIWSKQKDRIILDEPTHPIQQKFGL